MIKFHYRIISPKPLAPKGIDNHFKHSSIQIENPSFGPQNPNSPLRYQRYPTWHNNLRSRGNVRPQWPLKNFQNSTYVQRGNTDLNSTFSVSKTPVANWFYFYFGANYTKQHFRLDLPRSNSRSMWYTTISLSSSFRCVFFVEILVAEKESKRNQIAGVSLPKLRDFTAQVKDASEEKSQNSDHAQTLTFSFQLIFFNLFSQFYLPNQWNLGAKMTEVASKLGTHWGHATWGTFEEDVED